MSGAADGLLMGVPATPAGRASLGLAADVAQRRCACEVSGRDERVGPPSKGIDDPATPAVRPGTTHRGRPDQTPIIRASSQKQTTG